MRNDNIEKNETYNLEINDDKQNKKHIVLYIFLFMIVIFCFILLYARYISTSVIKVKEIPIYSNTISYDGLKVVHISDILYGSTVSGKTLDRLTEKINYLNPDIIVFTGDLISENIKVNNDVINNVTNFLSGVNAKYGKYAIRGDNDYKNDTFIEIMSNSNFNYLDNNYELVYLDNNKYIFIGGVNSSIKDKDDYNMLKEYNNNDVYKLVLLHEPNNTDELLKNVNVDLVLAGHSLNGQFRLPYIGGISYEEKSDRYVNDYYKINNTLLYVNNGIGTHNYPFRFLNSPTISFYRIIKKT